MAALNKGLFVYTIITKGFKLSTVMMNRFKYPTSQLHAFGLKITPMPLLHAKSREVTSGVAGGVSESYRKRGGD